MQSERWTSDQQHQCYMQSERHTSIKTMDSWVLQDQCHTSVRTMDNCVTQHQCHTSVRTLDNCITQHQCYTSAITSEAERIICRGNTVFSGSVISSRFHGLSLLGQMVRGVVQEVRCCIPRVVFDLCNIAIGF